jgi:hypothetical protein
MGTRKVGDALDFLNEWLHYDKTAEEAIVSTEEKVKDAEKAQGAAGKAQSAAAAESGGDQHVDGKAAAKPGQDVRNDEGAAGGPDTLLPEEPQKDYPVTKETSTMEQKTARAEALGSTLQAIIEASVQPVQKQAAQAPAKPVEKQAAQPVAGAKPAPAKPVESKFDKIAAEEGARYARFMKAGMEQRERDRQALLELNIKPEILEKVGGIDGLLDKAAEMNPAAVLTPEVIEELPPEDIEMLVGPEGAPEGVEGGEEEALAAVEQVMEEVGLSPEEAAAMLDDLVALKEEGYSDEEIMTALAEMAEEEQAGMAEGAPELAPEELAAPVA